MEPVGVAARRTPMPSVPLRAAALALLLLVAPTACTRSGPDPVAPTGAPPNQDVVMVRTGGFAGVHDTVTVSADGRWTSSDAQGRTVSGRLTEAQRDRLRTLAADPRLRDEASRATATTACRDSFTYTVTVRETRLGYEECPGGPARPETTGEIVDLLTEATRAPTTWAPSSPDTGTPTGR
ncbi:hypothetical protein ACNTMW_32175 [Planosporangium sp. 12N6]|uniref:hypothetical protein n=1 Tax=Planosporangium spinosum TaxID=3402278 RepID=UPI003CF4832E